MQLSEIRQDALSLLGQLANSQAGQLPSGVGTTPAITTTETLNQYINEAQNELARQVWPWEDTGTTTMTLGTRGVMFDAFTTAAGGTVFSASAVTWNGMALERIARDYASIYYRSIETDANGTPLYWSEWDLGGVLLYPWPNDTQDVFVVGLATPPPLIDDTDVPTFLPASLHKILSYYAAGKLAEKSVQNDDLAKRIQIWNTEYEQQRQALYAKALKTQPSLLARLEMIQGQGSGK